MSDQDTPTRRVDSGPTPAFPVNRTAVIPAVYVTPDGKSHGDDWPLSTTQTVTGRTSDGSEVTIGSASRQDGPNDPARALASTIRIRTPEGVTYSADLNANGTITGNGAGNLSTNRTAVANLNQLFDSITDVQNVSGATLDRTVDQFRRSSGIERK